MKVKVKVQRCKLVPPIDFGEAISQCRVCGVRLTYTEYDFIQFDGGKIVMFDAYSAAHKYSPFDAQFGPIAFPFYCGCPTDKGERVAYAGLRFCEEKAVMWKPVFTPSDKRILAVAPDAGGVPISSGVCCMADEDAYKTYRERLNDDVHPLAGHIVLDGQIHDRIETVGKTYAVFSTGWGDGKYNCYCGMSADGKVAVLIADFGLIEYPRENYELTETELDVPDGMYVYDPNKSESQNHIERWTYALEHADSPAERLRALSRRGYAYHAVGDTDKALGDYMSAVECCKQVTDLSERSRAWSVFDNAAEIFCERSDYGSAIKLMLGALETGDDFYAGAYVRLIDLYMLTKQTDSAVSIAERMLTTRPNDPVAYVKYAECCVAAMNYAAAASAYGKLASEFKLYENLFDEASCLIELGEYGKAGEALEKHPAKEYYEQYWYYKAIIDFKERRMFSALSNAERAYEIDGEFLPALYLLIDVNSLLNDYRAVVRYAGEYIRLRSDNEYGYSVCADAYLISGNISESSKVYSFLYSDVKQDDKYAALAAVTAAATADNKRSTKLLKLLRKKHSEYYYGALYGVYITRYRNPKVKLDKLLGLTNDADFLTMLSVFLFATGHVAQSSQILESLGRTAEPNYEQIAQQIRTAVRIGDKKHFMSFSDYYIEKFIGASVSADERKSIIERFIGVNVKRRAWLDEYGKEKSGPA